MGRHFEVVQMASIIIKGLTGVAEVGQ